ncbi:FxsA family protein [Brevibacillus fluminis]|uniref:FxsA family protein n=1 Tax=Brevibacillus fluminis TaxID=511487 RepID=A0A3M8DQ50_9BACL|nr:FxsA family protein [Brevibacillus fluminis]RNB89555.1 FxsA family protein [Brevibacillus fluminis]
MIRLLAVVFILASAVELWGLFLVGKAIGAGPTFLLILLTGVAGAYFAKKQGLEILRLIQVQLSRGQMPTDAVIDGVFILLGGLFLIMPGFLADIVGLMLLIPLTRAILRTLIKGWLLKQMTSGRIRFLFRR